MAGSRLYLHEAIADAFLARLVARAGLIRIGDPMDDETQMGPLCTLGQRDRIERELSHAVREGTRILCGGKRLDRDGLYFEATIEECPRLVLRIMAVELFGPVLAVLRFSTEAEVIALANDGKHGLAAGVFTRDGARQMRMAAALRAGIGWINTFRLVSSIAAFGGVKGSGYGRENGVQAMLDHTRPRQTLGFHTPAAILNNAMR